MCLAQGPQRSDAGEARTRGPSVSSQALYHWATALPRNHGLIVVNLAMIYLLTYFYIKKNSQKYCNYYVRSLIIQLF